MIENSRAARAATWAGRDGRLRDEALTLRFARRDPEAMADVYAHHGTSLYRTAYGVLGDRDLASEAVQRAMLRAWQNAHSFDHLRPLEPWLHAICRRTAIDTYRSHRRHPRPVDTDELDRQLPPAPTQVDHFSTASDVRQAIDTLPDGERDVVVLAYLDGFTYLEVADTLGIPVGTVKSRAHRAHRRLAGKLEHLHPKRGG